MIMSELFKSHYHKKWTYVMQYGIMNVMRIIFNDDYSVEFTTSYFLLIKRIFFVTLNWISH